MRSEWAAVRAADFICFNPQPPLKKGTCAPKITMDQLRDALLPRLLSGKLGLSAARL